MGGSIDQRSLKNRMIRAARLESHLYEEVEHDREATGQALTVVALVAVASGIGHGIGMIFAGRPLDLVGGLVWAAIGAIVGWAIWSGLTYYIGTKLLGGVATYGEVLRTVGFANSPGVLGIFGFVPFFGGILRLVIMVWSLAAVVIALRQALDFDTGKAAVTAILAAIPYFLIVLFIGVIQWFH